MNQKSVRVFVAFEYLHHFVIMHTPIENSMSFSSCHEHCFIVVCVRDQFDLMILHEELAILFSILCVVHNQGCRIGGINPLSVIREVQPNEILLVVFDDLG
jgi:hypothetical protein